MNRMVVLKSLLAVVILGAGCNKGKPPDDSTENLVAIIKSDAAPQIRKEAIHRLAHSGTEKGVEAVIEATFDTAWVVRRQAIISLKFFHSKEVKQRLQKLVQDINPKNQILAIETLYRTHKVDHLSTVLQFLKSDNPAIRSMAAQTFSYIPEKRFLEPLKKALEDETNPEVKAQLEKAVTFIEQPH